MNYKTNLKDSRRLTGDTVPQYKMNSTIFSTDYSNDWIIQYREITDSIESHLAYEKEFKEEVSRSKDVLEYYDSGKYIQAISSSTFPVKESKAQIIYKLSRIIVFDISNYKHITEQIYGEIVCTLINITASNLDQKSNSFLKDMYLEYSKSPYESQKEEILSLLKKYLRIYEELLVKNEKSTDSEEHNQDKSSEPYSNSQSTQSTNYTKDSNMYSETDNDIYGARKVLDLLYKYKLTDKKSLSKLLGRASFLYFGLRVLSSLIIFGVIAYIMLENDYLSTEVGNILGLIIEILWLIDFIKTIVFKVKLRNLRNLIRRVMDAAKVGESYLISNLSEQYGKKLSKIIA